MGLGVQGCFLRVLRLNRGSAPAVSGLDFCDYSHMDSIVVILQCIFTVYGVPDACWARKLHNVRGRWCIHDRRGPELQPLKLILSFD